MDYTRFFLFPLKGGAGLRKLLLILICLCLLLGNVFAASDEITRMEAQITVNSNGTCRVTVLAEVRFVTRPTTFEFPLGTDADDITASGASYDHKTRGGVECVVFENESGFYGSQIFQCSYSLPCTMWESGSGQHFSAKLPERGWEYPINHYNLSITFPTEITAFPQWSSSYYGDVIDNYMSIQVMDNTVTAESNIVFRDHETLSMELAFRPDVFTLKHLAEQTVAFDRLLYLFLYAACIIYWFVALRKNRIKTKGDPLFQFQFSAGEVPCQLYSDKVDVGGLIAHWGNLGYILLHYTRGRSFRLEKQMDMGNERSTAERRLFKSIFHSTSFIEVPGYRFLSAVNTEGSVLTAHWKRRMFQQKDGNPKVLTILCLLVGLSLSLMIFDTLLASTPGRWFWLIVLTLLSLPLYWAVQRIIPHYHRPSRWIFMGLGVGSAVILFLLASPAECGGFLFFNLLLQFGAGYVTRFGGQRTVPGQETVQELLRFRKFVAHSDRNSAKQCIKNNSQYFYTYLPYAEIMGVGERFLKHFGAVTTESCPWFVDEKNLIRSPKDFYKVYMDLLRRLRKEEALRTIRSLRGGFYIPLPRVRPGSNTGSRRNHTYTSSADRASSHTRSESRTTVPAGRRSPRRTQHRVNPTRTGRRR